MAYELESFTSYFGSYTMRIMYSSFDLDLENVNDLGGTPIFI